MDLYNNLVKIVNAWHVAKLIEIKFHVALRVLREY